MEFQSSVNEVDEVTREVVVSIGASELSRTVGESLAKLQRTVRIKGFRPGKAPLALVRKLHAKSETDRVINSLINESLTSVIRDSNLVTCGNPNVTLKSRGDGDSNLEYTAQVFLYPKIEIDLDTPFEVEIGQVPSVEEALEEALKGFMRQRVEFVPLADSRDVVQSGDGVTIVVKPKPEMEEGVAGTEKSVQETEETFIFGKREIPEDIEEQFAGRKVGETFELKIKGSEENPEVQPKALVAEIRKISQPVFPELTDEWVKGLGEGVETVEKLKEEFRERSAFLRARANENEIDRRILDQLESRASFKIPEFMIYDAIAAAHLKGKDHYWVSVKEMVHGLPETTRDQVVSDANRRVRNSLLLSEIGRLLEAEIDDEFFNEYVSRCINEFKFGIRHFNQEESERFSNNERMRREARSALIFEKLRARANVREVAPVSGDNA
jgi:trigger factor